MEYGRLAACVMHELHAINTRQIANTWEVLVWSLLVYHRRVPVEERHENVPKIRCRRKISPELYGANS